tara:strand:- start:63 stop:257 length:195 start_codon:yes stop_codon:yes gene_type:complete
MPLTLITWALAMVETAFQIITEMVSLFGTLAAEAVVAVILAEINPLGVVEAVVVMVQRVLRITI